MKNTHTVWKSYRWYLSRSGSCISRLVCPNDARTLTLRSLPPFPVPCTAQVSLFAFTDVVCRRVSDVVPKQVHHFLVDNICDGLVSWMQKKATDKDREVWFAEDSKTLRRRKEIARKLAQFQEAVKILEVVGSMG